MTVLFAICDDQWNLIKTAKSPMGLKAETGKTYSNASLASVADLRANFVLAIQHGDRPDQEWQTVVGNPVVVIAGDPEEPETMTATLEYTTQPITLESAKAKLKGRAKECRNRAMFGGYLWGRTEGESYIVQTDQDSRGNILEKESLAQRRITASDETLIPFRMGDNSTPKITPAEVIQIADAVAVLRDTCIEGHADHQTAIDALPDLAACMNYDCSVGFPLPPAIEPA